MAGWIEIADYVYPGGWQGSGADRARAYCERLEANAILYFSKPPFAFADADREFLVSQRKADSAVHKNVSYRPSEDALRGFEGTAETKQRLREVLRRYSQNVTAFVRDFWRRMTAITPLITRAFVPSRKSAGICRCTSATICCMWTRFPAGPRTAAGFCASSPTFIRRRCVYGM